VGPGWRPPTHGFGEAQAQQLQEYNWATCRDNNDSWESLEAGLEPFMRFARKHPSKQLIVAEFGSPEGANGQKAEWIDGARSLFKQGEYKNRFAAALYFHYDDAPNGNNRCNWWLDSSSSSLEAAKRLANDSFFRANVPEPEPERPAPEPTPEPEPLTPTPTPTPEPEPEPTPPVAEPEPPAPAPQPAPAPAAPAQPVVPEVQGVVEEVETRSSAAADGMYCSANADATRCLAAAAATGSRVVRAPT